MENEKLVKLSLPFSENRNITVRVYVPARSEEMNFPVIYMTDGQNLFYDEDSSFGCWHTMEAVKELSARTGKAAVIVGIHNDGAPLQRTCDLTPCSIGTLRYPPDMPEEIRRMCVPDGEAFESFIINTVMPAVEKDFPVKTGRENTAFCGSSSGGLFAFYIALNHPELFSFSGVFSPAPINMIYDYQEAEKWMLSKLGGNMPFLYMYSGGADQAEKDILSGLEQVCAFLEDKYPSELIKKVVSPDMKHHESAWEQVFRDFLAIFLSAQ